MFRPSFINRAHNLLCPPYCIRDCANGGRNSGRAIVLREFSRRKNTGRDQQHALTPFVHSSIVQLSPYIRQGGSNSGILYQAFDPATSLMATFANPRDFIDAIAEQFRQMHRGYEGAHFRAAFARDNGLRLLTASVLFRASQVPSRAAQDYGRILLVEEWVRLDEALDRLSQLTHGEAAIEGHKITDTFSYTQGDRQTYVGVHRWTGWRYFSRIDRGPNWKDFYLPQTPLLAHGQRPHLGAAGAVNEWMLPGQRSNETANTVLDQDCIVTMLPDTRAEIISAEWVPGLLRIEIRPSVPLDQLELQLLYADAKKRSDLIDVQPEMEIEVPEARHLHVFLMHTTNECIAELMLTAPYSTYGKAALRPSTRDAISDLENGETDTIEYKPFIEPNTRKETEFVETVIAFANTLGGRIYVGVQDDGSPQGDAELRRIFDGVPAIVAG